MSGERKAKKAETRRKVLESAKTCFGTLGYERATIRDIANTAKVSTGAIFANWPGKVELYRDVFGHRPVTPEFGRELLAGLRFAQSVIKSGEPWTPHCDDAIGGPLAKLAGA